MPRERRTRSVSLDVIDPQDFADKLRTAIEMRGDDECWPFVGVTGKSKAQERDQYGMITLGIKYEGYQLTAARAMLILVLGRNLRPGMVVCHLCHWKPCCNPRHLKEGTESDNYQSNSDEIMARIDAGRRRNLGLAKKPGTGEKQRNAQLTSRMRHCECGYSVNAGTMAGHIKRTGHRLNES